jgi:hypothetical protein
MENRATSPTLYSVDYDVRERQSGPKREAAADASEGWVAEGALVREVREVKRLYRRFSPYSRPITFGSGPAVKGALPLTVRRPQTD